MKTMELLPHETRRPRFRRHRFGKPPLVLQERDHEIIRLVADYRFITSEGIQVLIPGSDQTILRRLQKLYHGGYLDRPRSQQQRGNEKMIYALGQHGAHLLARLAGNEPPPIDWSEKNRQVRVQYLEHALMISRFRAVLTLAARLRSDVVVESWRQGNDLRDEVLAESDERIERIPVCPDAFFVLRLVNEPAGRNRVHVFLEADRGTMTAKRVLTKLAGYWHYWRSERPADRFGMQNFLVLTMTATDERAASLRSIAGEIDAPRHRGLRMFLFGSERNLSLDEPQKILEPIWETPTDETRHSLLE